MRNDSGFTLTELIVVIAIIAVISAIAVPNLMSWLPHHRLMTATQDLYSNFQKAKLTAIKRNTNCAVTFDNSGYTVFMDNNEDFIQDGGEEVIVQIEWEGYKNISVNLSDFTFDDSTGQPSIAFRPNGLPANAGGGFASGTAKIKNSNEESMSVIISQAGSIRIK